MPGDLAPPRAYLVGVDTGGTYTDAAVIEAVNHQVVATAKALTTRGDLTLGVGEALERALAATGEDEAGRNVKLVSVSTTLATNAVVEGHGSAVAVILIGFDQAMAERSGLRARLPGTPIELVAGGHDHNGDALGPLDLAALERAVARHAPAVEAFAVAASFAVRNPGHELAARELIERLTDRPVTLSSELSSSLDAPRRALTAALNARLIPRISKLIAAVRRAMGSLGIEAPLMIVKGDGTLALAEAVAVRPIETIVSGPAASVVGAAALSGLSDFIMADMGGTTTDLAVLLGGRPRIAPDGAAVGGWRTMVKAMDVVTVGLGGDSEVKVGLDGRLAIGPERVVPVALLAARFPAVLDALEAELAEGKGQSFAGRFVMRPLGAGAGEAGGSLSPREAELMGRIGEAPSALHKVAASSGAQRTLKNLLRKGLVQVAAFTPSDAAHVLGVQSTWSKEAAIRAARLLAWHRDMAQPSDERVREFCHEVWSEVVAASARVVLETALGERLEGDRLIEAVCRGEGRAGLAHVTVRPSLPVVAVGAPVRIYYPEVAARLGGEIVFPDHFEAANAVGAATGLVARTVEVEVTGDGAGSFRVHGPAGPRNFGDAASALQHAEGEAVEGARQAVLAMGAEAVETRVSVDKRLLPDALDDNGLFEALVTAEAMGRPSLGQES